jgi:hypothetical protein
MDITKYLKNKDIQVSADDFDIEKLEKDIRKGYVSSDEVDKARKTALDESKKSYSELEDKYTKLQNSYNDIEARNTQFASNEKNLKLQIEMVEQGFKKEQFEEIGALRNSLFKDEQDDSKAISMIKEKYKNTYFPETTVDVPQESGFETSSKPKEEIKVNRNTSISNLIIK